MIKKQLIFLTLFGSLVVSFALSLAAATPAAATGGGRTLTINLKGYAPNTTVAMTSDRHQIGSCGTSFDIQIDSIGQGTRQCISDVNLGIGWPDGTNLSAPDGDGLTASWSATSAIGMCPSAAASSNAICINIAPDSSVSVAQITATYTPGFASTNPAAAPSATYGGACDYSKTFFGLPVWYEYLKSYEHADSSGACSFDFSNGKKTTQVSDASAFVLIGLALVDILLRLIGIIAVIFVIVGGVRFVISQGEPDKIKQARGTIIGALVGVVIAVTAAAIVAFIGKKLGG